MSPLSLNGVTAAYGTRKVLHDVSVRFEAGQVTGLVGPNGAGKTTLMRAILGLVAPRAGSIRVFGQAASRGNPAVGYMPQTREAKLRPENVSIGTPIHSASEAVVWAP